MPRLSLACRVLVLLAPGCAPFAASAVVRHPTLLERWNTGGVALDVLHDAATDVRWFHVVGLTDSTADKAALAPRAVARMNRGLDRAALAIVRATRRHPQDPGAAAFFPGFVTPRWLVFEILEFGHGVAESGADSLLGFDGLTGEPLDLADRPAALATLGALRATLPPAELAAFDHFFASWNRR